MNRTLFDVYKRPSIAKRKAWDYCKQLCYKYSGYNLHIVSFNVFMFTASFDCIIDGIEHNMYITKTRNVLTVKGGDN